MPSNHPLRRSTLLALGGLTLALSPAFAASPALASATSNDVVYVRATPGVGNADDSSTIVLRNLATGVTRDLQPFAPGEYDDSPRLNASGSRVVYSTYRGPANATYGLALVNSDGSGQTRLTTPPDGVEDTQPSWAPDGLRVAFVRTDYTGSVPVSRLFSVDLSGNVTGFDIDGFAPAYSPDGTKLLYTQPGSTLAVRTFSTGQSAVLPVSSGSSPSWSPDGSQIAYTRVTNRDTFASEIHVVSAAGTGDRTLNTPVLRAYAPRWLPDGESVVYSVDQTLNPSDAGDSLWATDLTTGRTGPSVTPATGDSLIFGVDVQGPRPAAVTTSGSASGYTPVTPSRIFDSRADHGGNGPKGRIGAGQSVDVQITGSGGVPDGATAVVLNVTGVTPTADTAVTAYPAGTTKPRASNINLPHQTNVPNSVTVALSSDGKISLFNSAGDLDLIADVSGYYAAGSGAGFGSVPTPSRVFDSRPGRTPGGTGRLGAGGTVDIAVNGVAGVPLDATAVVLNITGITPSDATLLQAYPTPVAVDNTVPGVSTVNLPAFQNVANLAVVPVGDGGRIRLRNEVGTVDAAVDVSGYYTPTGGAYFQPIQPVRFVDTRDGLGTSPVQLGQAQYVDAHVTGARGIPANAVAVAANLTAVGPSTATLLRAFPAGGTAPQVSNLNITSGVRANAAYLLPSGAGRTRVFNDAGTVHVLVDVNGYFLPRV